MVRTADISARSHMSPSLKDTSSRVHARPIAVLEKRDPSAHREISNLHTLGCMLPYTGLHHLLFHYLTHPLLIMTSANMPGYPMITDIDQAMAKMNRDVDFFLTHDRKIQPVR